VEMCDDVHFNNILCGFVEIVYSSKFGAARQFFWCPVTASGTYIDSGTKGTTLKYVERLNRAINFLTRIYRPFFESFLVVGPAISLDFKPFMVLDDS
jgi:hypothetical protein